MSGESNETGSGAPGAPIGRLGERLEAWAAEVDAWAQQREGLLLLLELVTRDHPNSASLTAINQQLRATLEQLQAMVEQLRAIRKQLEVVTGDEGGSAPS